jgi:hypothetical protein
MWYVLRTGEVHTAVWWGNMRERGHLKDLGVDGRIILKWTFVKYNEGLGLFDVVYPVTGGGLFEQGNEP